MGKLYKIDYPEGMIPMKNDTELFNRWATGDDWESIPYVSLDIDDQQVVESISWCRSQFGMEGERWCLDLMFGKSSTTWLFQDEEDKILFQLAWS